MKRMHVNLRVKDLDASIAGTVAAAGWLATSSGRPTAAITPSTTSTDPGS